MINLTIKNGNNITYILHSSCEYDNFIKFCHLCEELVTAWPDEEGTLATNFKVMDEGLIEV